MIPFPIPPQTGDLHAWARALIAALQRELGRAETATGYTDKQAQDAVGAMIADTTTINLTYTGATPELKADIITGSVSNSLLASMTEATFKGRAAGSGTGAPVDLNSTQATAILDLFTATTKGVVAASGGGTANFLRADGSWVAPPGSSGGGSATIVEVDLGSTLVARGKFTIVDALILASSKVLCWKAPGPYTGKGTRADEAEMDPLNVVCVYPATGSAVVVWESALAVGLVQEELGGNDVRVSLSALAPPQDDPQAWPRPRRRGVTRGNHKFAYTILS